MIPLPQASKAMIPDPRPVPDPFGSGRFPWPASDSGVLCLGLRDLTKDNFGLLIAYLLPGSVALWGVSYHSEIVEAWLRSAPPDAPTVGGFLYATLASTALGLVVSAVRWAILDRAFAWAGVRPTDWDFALLSERLAAFETIVAYHYSYYQFYANTFVAVAFSALAFLRSDEARPVQAGWFLASVLAVEIILLLGAWDTLRKYYARTGALLSGASAAGSRRSRGRTDLRSK